MCGRNSLFVPDSKLRQRFNAKGGDALVPRYNIAPEQDQAVITDAEPDVIQTIEWGFTVPWDDKKRLINARGESVHEKRSFKEAFEQRRCLVLADGYYEWQPQPKGPKQPYRVQRADGEPFAFAGLWNPANGYEKPTFVIITTEPNDTVEPIHDRMPAMLESEDEVAWLGDGEPDALRELLDPYPDEPLEAYPISTKVNNPGYDRPDVIEPLGTEQSGIGEFG